MECAQELGLEQPRPCSKHVRFRVRHVARNLWTHVEVTTEGSVQDLLDLSLVACDLLSASAVQTVISEKPHLDAEKRERECKSQHEPGNIYTGAHDFAVTQNAKMQEKFDRMRKLVHAELDETFARKYRPSLPASFRRPSGGQKRRHSSFMPLSLSRFPTVPLCEKPARSLKGTLGNLNETDYMADRITPGQRKQQNDRRAAKSHLDYPLHQDQYPSYHPSASNNISPLAMRLQHFFGGRKRTVTLGSPENGKLAAGFQNLYKEVENARAEYAIFWVNGGHWLDEYRTIASYKFDAGQDLFELQSRQRYIPIDYFQPNFPLGENYAEGYLRELPECWNESMNPAFLSATASFSKIPVWSPSNPCCYVGWKKRWCVLRNHQLYCYKKAKDTSILLSYDLSGLTAVTTRTGLMPSDTPKSIVEQAQSPGLLVLVLQISNSANLTGMFENHITSTASVKQLTLQAETVKEFEHWNRIFKALIKGSPKTSNCSPPASATDTSPVVAPPIPSSGDTAKGAIPVSDQRSTSLISGTLNNGKHKKKYKVRLQNEKHGAVNSNENHATAASITAPKSAVGKGHTLQLNMTKMTENDIVSYQTPVPPDRRMRECSPPHVGPIPSHIPQISPGLGIHFDHPPTPPPLPPRSIYQPLPEMASTTSSPTTPTTHLLSLSEIDPCALPGDGEEIVPRPTVSNSCLLRRIKSRSSSLSSKSHSSLRKSTRSTSPSFSATQSVARFARSLAKATNRKSVHIPIRHGSRNYGTAEKAQQQADGLWSDRSGSIDDITLIESSVHSDFTDDSRVQQNDVLGDESREGSLELALPPHTHGRQPDKLATSMEGKVDYDMDSRIRTLMMNDIAWLNEDLGSILNREDDRRTM